MYQEDLSPLCRLCLENSTEMVDVEAIYDEELNLSFSECFTMCTQIVLAKGQPYLPQNLCKLCAVEVHTAYEFYKKVDESKCFVKAYQEQWERTKFMTRLAIEDKNDNNFERNSNESIEEPGTKFNNIIKLDVNMEELAIDQAELVRVFCENATNEGINEQSSELHLAENSQTVAETDANLIIQAHDSAYTIQLANETCMRIGADAEATFTILETDFEPSEAFLQEPLSENHNITASTEQQANEIQQTNITSTVNSNKFEAQKTVSKQINKVNRRNKKLGSQLNKIATPRIRGPCHCDICDKFFKNFSRMILHRQSHDPKRQRHACEICGRDYANKQALMVHVRAEHKKDGYICAICGKVFAVRTGFEIHMRYHTGEFPYCCDLCEKKFAQAGHLKTHKDIKHNNMRFWCDQAGCGKYFTSSASLRNHEYSHGPLPFLCEICQRGYTSKSKLKNHITNKHNIVMSLEDLERMRQFEVGRSKVNIVQLSDIEQTVDDM